MLLKSRLKRVAFSNINEEEKQQLLDDIFKKKTFTERFEEVRRERIEIDKIASVKTKPNESRFNDFNFALADYFFKELKKRGLRVSKKSNIIINLAFDRVTDGRYNSITIDCLEGSMYLSGGKHKDRKIGKLIDFNGSRTSDAYHCMKKSINKILKKIEKYSIEVVVNDSRKPKRGRPRKNKK